MADSAGVLLLLMRDGCAFCHDAEDIVDRLAREYDLSVERMDLDTPEGRGMAERGGVLFPPGIFFNEDSVCYGRPSERRLRRAIERALAGAPDRADQ
jgi:hypothetical protein